MTNREQIIFNSLLKKSSELHKLNTSDISMVQVRENDILIWWKDRNEDYKLKVINVNLLQPVDDFIRESIKEHREIVIEEIID